MKNYQANLRVTPRCVDSITELKELLQSVHRPSRCEKMETMHLHTRLVVIPTGPKRILAKINFLNTLCPCHGDCQPNEPELSVSHWWFK